MHMILAARTITPREIHIFAHYPEENAKPMGWLLCVSECALSLTLCVFSRPFLFFLSSLSGTFSQCMCVRIFESSSVAQVKMS